MHIILIVVFFVGSLLFRLTKAFPIDLIFFLIGTIILWEYLDPTGFRSVLEAATDWLVAH